MALQVTSGWMSNNVQEFASSVEYIVSKLSLVFMYVKFRNHLIVAEKSWKLLLFTSYYLDAGLKKIITTETNGYLIK